MNAQELISQVTTVRFLYWDEAPVEMSVHEALTEIGNNREAGSRIEALVDGTWIPVFWKGYGRSAFYPERVWFQTAGGSQVGLSLSFPERKGKAFPY